MYVNLYVIFFFSSRRRHTRCGRDWSSDVCSSDLKNHYGTKIYDYLASGSHILFSPPDSSIVEDLIRNHENGSVANTAEEVVQRSEERRVGKSVDIDVCRIIKK